MSFLSAIPIVGNLVEKVIGVVDQAVPDKDLKEQLKADIQKQALSMDYSVIEKELDARAAIITAEAKSESWIARNWRPMIMLLFGIVIALNYVIVPILAVFGVASLTIVIPTAMWDLLKLGISGYIVGRSGEKMINVWKNGKGGK